MNGSHCRRGDGTWWPARERCPICAGEVGPAVVPPEGRLLAVTGDPPVGVVALGEAVVPALVEGAAAGASVLVEEMPDGRLRARPR